MLKHKVDYIIPGSILFDDILRKEIDELIESHESHGSVVEKLVNLLDHCVFTSVFGEVNSVHVMLTIIPHNLLGVDVTNLTEMVGHER